MEHHAVAGEHGLGDVPRRIYGFVVVQFLVEFHKFDDAVHSILKVHRADCHKTRPFDFLAIGGSHIFGHAKPNKEVAALENLARDHGFSELKLETGVYSPAAIRTYERAGYARCERFGDYPFAPTSVYMTKNLS